MHGTYQQNQKSMERWRAKNPEKIKQYYNRQNKKRCEWFKIQRLFLKILL